MIEIVGFHPLDNREGNIYKIISRDSDIPTVITLHDNSFYTITKIESIYETNFTLFAKVQFPNKQKYYNLTLKVSTIKSIDNLYFRYLYGD